MKNVRTQTLACLFIAFAATVVLADGNGFRRGTSVLHYKTRNTLAATEADSNVTGTVRLELNEQGHSAQQRFDLNVRGLVPGSNYFLLASIGEDTNVAYVATVKASRQGRLEFTSRNKGHGHDDGDEGDDDQGENKNKHGDNGGGHHHGEGEHNGGGKQTLPDALNPVTNIRAIELQEASQTQTVAFAWINTSSNFNYIVKRNLTLEDTNSTARGSISLVANQDHVNFRLVADGLGASNTCYLALNSTIVDTAMTDDHGRIQIKNWPSGSPAILDLRSLAVLDAVSNVVLTTTLPK